MRIAGNKECRKSVTTLIDFEESISRFDNGDIPLEGACKSCGGRVNRVIEYSERPMLGLRNRQRRRQLKEFADKPHQAMHEFYDFMETVESDDQIKRKMRALIKKDPDFYDPYLQLADVLIDEDREHEAGKLIRQAYERAVLRIADSQGRWPQQMMWGWLENRHLMRALQRYAIWLWDDQNRPEATLEIMRKLLRANPNDNQGARYEILAIRLGLNRDWEEQFMITEGPMAGRALDVIAVDKWFRQGARKFPDEFNWWVAEMEERDRV